jgi:hypothetical protein
VQAKASLFGTLAVISFIITFLAVNFVFFLPAAFGGFDPNFRAAISCLWVWGIPATIFFAILAWRNGAAAEQKRQHDETMEGLKAIYRVLRVQLDDAPPPKPANKTTVKETASPGQGLGTWYDLTQEERELIRKHRGS